MHSITLYSTGCPMCKALETMLARNSVDYRIESNVEVMKELGITHAPVLEVDGNRYSYPEAVKWVNTTRAGGQE